MHGMKSLYRSFFFVVLLVDWLPVSVLAQTATVIADTAAAKQIGEKVTVEGIVVEVFTHGRTSSLISATHIPINHHRLDPAELRTCGRIEVL
jgi:hypothetical protein